MLDISDNLFTFEDILPHLSLLSSYAPQKRIPVDPLLSINDNGAAVIDIQFDADVTGKIVEARWLQNGNNGQLDAAYIPSGVYFIRIIDAGRLHRTTRVIKY